MRYNTVKDSDKIISRSAFVINNPFNYKNKWNDLFQNKNEIHLELGMGRGDFIINMAKKYPNINFVGLELDEGQIATAAKRLENNECKNLKLIKADARDLDKIFGREINTIYLTFSEPWPKKKDANKRFTHESYLRLYDRIFKKNKHIIMKTDNKILFASALESLSQYWYEFKRVSLDLHHDENNIENIMTDFEKQYFKENRQIYYVDAISDK